MPEFDKDQFEGRIERPIGPSSVGVMRVLVGGVLIVLAAQSVNLQLVRGASFAERALNNQLERQTVFADRGIITDRTGKTLAINVRENIEDDFGKRVYEPSRGLAHVVGYVKSPAKDSSGFYFRDEFIGIDGVERAYNTELAGKAGVKLVETDVHGEVVSGGVVEPPVPGKKLVLSIDANVSQGLYDAIADKVNKSHFQGGAGVLMDVQTGEILAMVSYPEYSLSAMAGGDAAAIKALNSDTRQPFLNRVVNGLYAPGSIVKPVMGIAALTEGVITPEKQIQSTGSISIPNPYDKDNPTVFKDWRAHGWVDLRHAISVSSDVYFYAIGGGYEGQKGMGIETIDKYFRLFGFGTSTGLFGFNEPDGTIPTPEWKEENFPGDPWRVGNTYHTVIGQYGVTATPLQAVRQVAAIANGVGLLTPTLIASSTPQIEIINLPQENIQIAREGMRLSVTEGIAAAVKFDFLHVAAKTGTAQIGSKNQFLNSWMIGFFPYEKPRYAFAVVLERAPAGTLIGASAAMGEFLQWLHQHAPEYEQ